MRNTDFVKNFLQKLLSCTYGGEGKLCYIRLISIDQNIMKPLIYAKRYLIKTHVLA